MLYEVITDTRAPLLISLGAYWVVGLGLGSWLAFGLELGPRGLWFGLTAGLFTAAAALLGRFLHRTRPRQNGEQAGQIPDGSTRGT